MEQLHIQNQEDGYISKTLQSYVIYMHVFVFALSTFRGRGYGGAINQSQDFSWKTEVCDLCFISPFSFFQFVFRSLSQSKLHDWIKKKIIWVQTYPITAPQDKLVPSSRCFYSILLATIYVEFWVGQWCDSWPTPKTCLLG